MNRNELLAAIKRRGLTMTKFLKAIKMPSSTWSKKIRGISEFTRSEICTIINVLKLNQLEIIDIFFNTKVS